MGIVFAIRQQDKKGHCTEQLALTLTRLDGNNKGSKRGKLKRAALGRWTAFSATFCPNSPKSICDSLDRDPAAVLPKP